MKKNILLTIFLSLVIGFGILYLVLLQVRSVKQTNISATDTNQLNLEQSLSEAHPLQIEQMRKSASWRTGSDLVIEQELSYGTNYKRYIVSYKSEGLKIYGLLTVPTTEKPTTGFPVIIFNHGYILPSKYSTTERYVAYVDGFARSGYIVFKPDFRGHGNSEGQASGGYGSTAYTVDVLNAVSSLKKYPDADPNRIGMWGHSMGGHITLRSMVVSSDIKAGVIWAGVVASYPDLVSRWRRGTPPASSPTGARRWRQQLTEEYGTPDQNPTFWSSISPNSYLSDISGPLQLHHGTADSSVPVEFSRKLKESLTKAKKEVEYYEYKGDDHNLTYNFNTAMQRSIEFFDKHLKN